MRLLAGGTSSDEIARTLYISPSTVKRHIGEILHKLDVRSRAEAVEVRRCYTYGLEPGEQRSHLLRK